jgi:hypothetical protein
MISSNSAPFLSLLFFVFLSLAGSSVALASDVALPHTQVTIAVDEKAGDEHDDAYYRKLLKLTLEKTVSTFGPYTIKIVPFIYVDSRLVRAVEENKVSVTWRHYQQNLSLPLLPIKIDLLKRMGDYRVFLIRENDQERFSNINSLDDLKKFRGGMGAQWPDRGVMEKNGLPLVFSVNYFILFNLMLQYDNPLYFFVNEKNTLLAKRIEEGLTIAKADGNFDAVFNQFSRFAWAQKLIDENQRLIFNLDR